MRTTNAAIRVLVPAIFLGVAMGIPAVAVAAPPFTPCLVVPGSYLRTDVTNVNHEGDDVIELRADGTGYFYQGNAIELMDSGGTSIPAVGTWACGPGNTVILTTISYYAPNVNSDLTDAYRFTHQIQFKLRDLEHPVVLQRVFIDFALSPGGALPDLLDPNGGTVVSTPLTAPRQLALIKPLASDLSR